MKTHPNGARTYTADDVDHNRVRLAMKAVGDRMTAAMIAEMRSRGIEPCVGVDARSKLPCNSESVGFYVTGHRCEQHTPAAEHGHPEPSPGCNFPQRCYCPKHRGVTQVDNTRARAELVEQAVEWVNMVKSEVLVLARLKLPFGLAELVEFLPKRSDPMRPAVEAQLVELLGEGVERGLIVKHPIRNEWKGAT